MVTSDLGACEWFVWDLRRSGLIDRGQLDSIVGEFLKRNPRAEAPALAEYLVEQGTLTTFQAERVLNGKTQGLVLGPYVLLDAIGAGSMGQVYKACSKNDNNLYAVKVLPRRSMWNVRLARRQVRSFAGFTHPAVVPFVDVGTAGGLHYLVWPLVEGTTLEALVQQNGKLAPNLAAFYAVQIAQGLTDAQQNTLFHGLLKPSNVMIGPDNQARILDFGIGSLLVENEGESLVDTMSTANTLTSGLDCASPESIMEPTNRTPAGDQYSLGCVLYFCLTGRVPFAEGSAVEKMMAHQTKEPVPIRQLAPDAPEGLVAVVTKLMSKKPEERYGACDTVVEAIQPFVGDLAAIPGGVPTAKGVPTISGSSARMAGLGSRGGVGGSVGRLPGLPSKAAPSTPPPSGERPVPGRANPAPSGERPMPGRTPPPAPGRSGSALPRRSMMGVPVPPQPQPPAPRASTQSRVNRLPTRTSTAVVPPSRLPESGTRATPAMPVAETNTDNLPLGWAEEEEAPAKKSLSPLALVGIALVLMITVYIGATMMMR
jgi:serine/threonine protein kinase